jgi:hypothetical protein
VDSSSDNPAAELRRRLDMTGIGFAGLDGAWWRPAVEPFPLPGYLADDLAAASAAVFALLDVLSELYDAPGGAAVRALLGERVPPHIPRLVSRDPALMLRPDFQLHADADGRYRLVATELESCPAAQGYAHAMQVAYGLEADLADWFARFLRGRPLIFAGTVQWSELLFEQLAFCRALAERGETAYILYDRPLRDIAAQAARAELWAPPMCDVPRATPGWNDDVLGRLRARDLARFVWPDDERWPATVGEAVVFRFGYFDNFSPAVLRAFARWRAAGAIFLNPLSYYLESKSVLAAARLPSVRAALAARDPAWPAALDAALPETHVLRPEAAPWFTSEREAWVLKVAGYDGDNRAWGGRGVQFGADCSREAWDALLRETKRLPWPFVVQRRFPSAPVNVGYFDAAGRPDQMAGANTRLRAFLLRDAAGARPTVAGVHLTAAARAKVSEAIDAVQAPVQFIP